MGLVLERNDVPVTALYINGKRCERTMSELENQHTLLFSPRNCLRHNPTSKSSETEYARRGPTEYTPDKREKSRSQGGTPSCTSPEGRDSLVQAPDFETLPERHTNAETGLICEYCQHDI